MDFDKYVNSLKDIDSQENKAELESFYTLYAATFQFFKAIDKAIQDVLKKSNVGGTVIKQLESILPTLTKLKKEISKLDSETFAVGYKTKISQSVTNIKNGMTLSEVNDTAQDFFDLLKENKQAIIADEQEKKRKEKEATERKANEEKIRKQREEAERRTREEREREAIRLQQLKHRVLFNHLNGTGNIINSSTMETKIEIYIDNLFFAKLSKGQYIETYLQHGQHNIKLQTPRVDFKKQTEEFNINVHKDMTINAQLQWSFWSVKKIIYNIQ